MNLRTFQLALRPFVVFLSGILLVGCAEDRHTGGGGFETGDLQARVSAPSGKAAARALVWLVSSQNDSAPAIVLDSAWTDSAGVAIFTLPDGAKRSDLGLDAKLGDSLGIATGGFAHSDSSTVALAKSGTVEVWLDSTKELPTLFVPGSHFASTASASEPKSVLRLPQGAWNVRLKRSKGTSLTQQVTLGDQTIQIGGQAWSTKSLSWSDSVKIPGGFMDSVLYRDTSLGALHRWQRMIGAIGTQAYSDTLVSGAQGITSMRTKPVSVQSDSQIGAGISSPRLPPQGAMFLTYKFVRDPDLDSGLLRTLRLVDTANNGLQIQFASDLKSPLTISTLGNAQMASDSVAMFPLDPIKVTDWTLIWTGKYIELRQGNTLLARCYSGWDLSKGIAVQPSLSLELGSTRTGLNAEIQIASLKLYQPK